MAAPDDAHDRAIARQSSGQTDAGPRRPYVAIPRAEFSEDDPIWYDGSPFDRRSAWIDLRRRAAWRPMMYRTAHGTDWLERGEFVASLRYLADAWQWSKSKVERFLDKLETSGRIARRRAGQHGAVYLVANFDDAPSQASVAGTPDAGVERGTPNVTLTTPEKRDTTHGTTQDTHRDTGVDAYPTASPPVTGHPQPNSGTPTETAASAKAGQHRDTSGTKNSSTSSTSSNASKTLGPSLRDAPSEYAASPTRTDYPPEFEACWAAYPKRPNNSKRDTYRAWQSRRRSGAAAEDLHAGTERYHRYCVARGIVGSEFVKQGSTFFGPGEHWAEPYDVTDAVRGLTLTPGGVLRTSPEAFEEARTLWQRYVRFNLLTRWPASEYERIGAEMVAEGLYPDVDAAKAELRITQPWTLNECGDDAKAAREIATRLAAARRQASSRSSPAAPIAGAA